MLGVTSILGCGGCRSRTEIDFNKYNTHVIGNKYKDDSDKTIRAKTKTKEPEVEKAPDYSIPGLNKFGEKEPKVPFVSPSYDSEPSIAFPWARTAIDILKGYINPKTSQATDVPYEVIGFVPKDIPKPNIPRLEPPTLDTKSTKDYPVVPLSEITDMIDDYKQKNPQISDTPSVPELFIPNPAKLDTKKPTDTDKPYKGPIIYQTLPHPDQIIGQPQSEQVPGQVPMQYKPKTNYTLGDINEGTRRAIGFPNKHHYLKDYFDEVRAERELESIPSPAYDTTNEPAPEPSPGPYPDSDYTPNINPGIDFLRPPVAPPDPDVYKDDGIKGWRPSTEDTQKEF